MSVFGDSNWNKNDLFDNLNMFFEQGGTVVELFDVIHMVFQYGKTPQDVSQERINKALHRIQLLQMDGEVTVRDLGLIVRDLRGDENDN